jgi:hypothetical protein
MDIQELEKWVTEGDEGKAWLENQKRPLLIKRDELLAALKESNAKLAEQDQRSAAAADELSQERAALSAVLVDGALASLLKNAHVFEVLIPEVVNSLKNAHGITVKASGADRMAVGTLKDKDGNETEAGLDTIVKAWAELPGSKNVIQNMNNGGGARGGSMVGRTPPPPSLKRLSGRDLAAMSDAEFNDVRNSALNSAEESL